MIKKIAILTSGGDSPGMNNTIRAVVKAAKAKGIESFLVYEGYKGLTEGNIHSSDKTNIDHYINQGGTFIFSARFPEFKKPEVRQKAKEQLDKLGIEALVVIGGDGSYQGAQLLHTIGVKTIGLPGTIDNDISSTDFTIGFDTALNAIVENVDRIRDTSRSHHRAMIVEVMGRYAGDLAIYSGIATGSELIITAERVLSVDEIVKVVDHQMNVLKKDSMIIITSEHIYENIDQLAKEIEQKTNIVTRGCILAHLQRGGNPTAMERVLATKMGTYAVELLLTGQSGVAIGIKENKLVNFPILDALNQPRTLYLDDVIKYSKINQEK